MREGWNRRGSERECELVGGGERERARERARARDGVQERERAKSARER